MKWKRNKLTQKVIKNKKVNYIKRKKRNLI